MIWRYRVFLLAFATVINSVGPAAADQVVYSDQTFEPTDWTPLVYVRDDPSVGGVTSLFSLGSVAQQTIGGNPGAYLRSIHHVFFGDIVNTVGIYIDESYDPRERAISTVDFSYSVNHFEATAGTSTAVVPALLQSGKLFVGPGQLFSGTLWTPLSETSLVADDFFGVDMWFGGPVSHPDFSAFGDPIQFGYSLQNNVAFGPGFENARGLDNWSVTIEQAEMSDIHGDGVDSVDFDLWNTGFGLSEDALLTDGDFDDDDDVDGFDFLKWQRQFGSGVPLQAVIATVPEPGSLAMMAIMLVLTGIRVRRDSRFALPHAIGANRF
jgi:hypothetical protein